ncbi:MAG: hypothetical protein JWO36_5974 [Myxococcales bacterium]|nr:hypothetical protein [Myxococcales bacterium]
MTHPARHSTERNAARPTHWMWIASDAAHLVATDAERLAGAVVTARARCRIAARLAPVLVVGGSETDPAGRMWAAASVAGDAAREMTRRAAIRRVASRARTRLGARFEGVTRGEAGAMHARSERIGEMSRRGQYRHGLAMTVRAELLPMTRLTEIARRRRAGPVLVHPIAVVCEMALRQQACVFEIAMTRIAFPRVASRVVVVAAKARRHRRP